MAKEKKDQLVTVGSESLATRDRPEYLETKGKSREGLEDIKREDLILPRLSICQSMSPQRKKSDPLFIKELEEGDFFNSVTEQIYGAGMLRVIPLLFRKSRLYFKKMEEGGGLLCQSMNGINGGRLNPESCDLCLKSHWGDDGEKPECTLLYNFPSVLLPAFELIVVSMKVTSLKTARQWLTLWRIKDRDARAGVYELRAVETKNNFGTFYIFNVKPARWASEKEFDVASQIYHSIADRQIQPSKIGLAEEETAERPPKM